MLYTVRQKKVHFSKFPHMNISKYFQEIVIRVRIAMGLFYDTKNSDNIVCLSEQEPCL